MNLALYAFVAAAAAWLDPSHDYSEISWAITNVVDRERPLFANDDDKRRTASLVVAVAWREGSLRLRIHGDCKDDKGRAVRTPSSGVCPRPHSFCTMQVHDTSGGAEALNDDPEVCIQTGLTMLRASAHVDALNPVAFYARGPRLWQSEEARRLSRDRVFLAHRIFDVAVRSDELAP